MLSNLSMMPLQVDVSTALKLTKNEGMYKERTLMARTDAWHRIKILRGAKYDKDFVLQSILSAAEPADIIPVRYQNIGVEDTCFIARNCGPALEKLCKSNLIIKIPRSDPFILVLTLGFASIQDLKVSIQPLIVTLLTKRFDRSKKSLDLNNFHRDEDIANHVYCPLSQTRTFSNVLKITKHAIAEFEHLNLQNNQLSSLTALENSNLTTIISLDLRNNILIGMEALTPIRVLSIQELWLDGNPLCENYSSAQQYIESAKKYCPHLVKLDGMTLDDEIMPTVMQHYFPNKKLEKLIRQFTNHFFTIHDQIDKLSLKGLYHEEAVYSLTIIVKTTKINRRGLGFHMAENRNLLNQPNLIKDNLLYNGSDEIVGALKKLPHCLHDRSTFRYDAIYWDDRVVVFTVDGFFKYVNAGPQLISFSRTFILIALSENEFKIVNDQYHIDTNGTKSPSNFETKLSNINCELVSFSTGEKEHLVNMLMNFTTMNREWSRRFLDDVNWDLKRALLNFMNVYSSSHMTADAF